MRHCGQLFSLRGAGSREGNMLRASTSPGPERGAGASTGMNSGRLVCVGLARHVCPWQAQAAACHSHLGAQPSLDAVLAEAVHAGRHCTRVLDNSCFVGQEGRQLAQLVSSAAEREPDARSVQCLEGVSSLATWVQK